MAYFPGRQELVGEIDGKYQVGGAPAVYSYLKYLSPKQLYELKMECETFGGFSSPEIDDVVDNFLNKPSTKKLIAKYEKEMEEDNTPVD